MNRISGNTEFDVFKNYYTEETRVRCRLKVNMLPLQSKDHVESERLRQLAKPYYAAGKYYDCLEMYTESLRYAPCNGREYALALANRSATYFSMDNYKNCLIDIGLCLQADYPLNLKPKILIRKAKCFIKMGNLKKMVETIDDCCNQMQTNSKLPKIDKDNYMKEMKSVMNIKQVDIRTLPLEETDFAPEVILEENKVNPNMSASIKLIHSNDTRTDYIAARDIPRGEVLFVDAAYSVGFTRHLDDEPAIGIFSICNYCWKRASNCIPCKTCVNYSYCSEDCCNSDWTEYHQWECDMFRSILISGEFRLPVRTLIKGAVSGAIFKIRNDTKSWKSSDAVNPYLHIYSLYLDLASFRSKFTTKFVQYCEQAACMVEFLKKSNFFTRLMSVPSCEKDFDTLVNFVGGLLIRHIIQAYQKSLIMNCASSIVQITQTDFEFFVSSRNVQLHAFCPVVSGIKYSCESNTSMYFNGSTCIVKACQDIKAGNCIFRSGFNFTPGIPAHVRESKLQEIDINCDCTACKNINNNVDILNTYLCIECGRFALLQIMQSPFMVCNNCKQTASVEAVDLMFGFERIDAILKENVACGQYFENLIIGLNKLKKLMNPNHERLYMGYRELLLLCSKRENLEEFKKALLDFKTCAKNRNGRFDTYQYLFDLTITICKACFTYLQLNKSILRKQEIMDMLTYSSDVINEAKEIAEFTFPPFLRLCASFEFMIIEFRVADVSLED